MTIPVYQVDAFSGELFSGNPAAVCPLSEWLPDTLMQNIAMENNLAETAFFVRNGDRFHIRWFTPEAEVKLCGHATVACSHVLVNCLAYSEKMIRFDSLSGELRVTQENNFYTLDFPSDHVSESLPPEGFYEAMTREPLELYRGKTDYLFVVGSEEEVKNISPDFAKLRGVECRGVIVTAPGNTTDFVSRFFAPAVGINEDPVTGSAHTLLTPYWSNRLGKTKMKALQLSKRGGELELEYCGERTMIGGKAKLFLSGQIHLG